MKLDLSKQYDFTLKLAFNAIDDWGYGYFDAKNIKRFLRSMNYVASKQQIIGVLRRFDLDGDAKVNFEEFQNGIKTSLTQFAVRKSLQRPKSGVN